LPDETFDACPNNLRRLAGEAAPAAAFSPLAITKSIAAGAAAQQRACGAARLLIIANGEDLHAARDALAALAPLRSGSSRLRFFMGYRAQPVARVSRTT
jgi:hypothetical protein